MFFLRIWSKLKYILIILRIKMIQTCGGGGVPAGSVQTLAEESVGKSRLALQMTPVFFSPIQVERRKIENKNFSTRSREVIAWKNSLK
jgi:hypothetical protein